MELGKPPVIEAWIDFRFQPHENAASWDHQAAISFIQDNFEDQYTVESGLMRTEFTVNVEANMPELISPEIILERIRAKNSDGDRFVQAGRDVLIFNILRKRDMWPRYPALRDEALAAYDTYVVATRPTSVRSISLHYRDVVCIPLDADKRIQLGQYFKIYPQVPDEPLGAVSDFMFDMTLPEISSSGIMKLVIKSEPTSMAEGIAEGRFRMDWNIISQYQEVPEHEVVAEWLDNAHNDLLVGFKSAFTEKGWELFEPKESR